MACSQRLRAGWLFTVLALAGSVAAAWASAPSLASSPKGVSRVATMDVGQLRPGMKGHGLTVFRGSRPERFDVEVIDVLRSFRPDQDLVLIRLNNPFLQRAKVVAGMSGSPIYVGGKLIGAYAYGWTFQSDAIGGVTPIANMLRELSRPLKFLDPVSRAFVGRPITKRRLAYRDQRVTSHDVMGSWRRLAGDMPPTSVPVEYPGFERAMTPVMLGGFTEHSAEFLKRELAPFGLIPIQAGGAQRTRAVKSAASGPPFEPGSAVGVQLIRGDISATAVGTVTHVSGNRLVAFGHPMLNLGESGLPTARARVVHILTSQARSFKIAEAIAPAGMLIHDRPSGIVVDASRVAPTIPVHIRFHGVGKAPRTQWRTEIAKHPVLSPMLTFSVLANTIQATLSDVSDITFDVTARVRLDGFARPIQLRDRGVSNAGLSGAFLLQLRLFALLAAAQNNPFRQVSVDGIDLDVNVRSGMELLEIVDASVPIRRGRPGRERVVAGRPATARRQGVHSHHECTDSRTCRRTHAGHRGATGG